MRTTKPGDWVRLCFNGRLHQRACLGCKYWKVVKVVSEGVILENNFLGPQRSWIIVRS